MRDDLHPIEAISLLAVIELYADTFSITQFPIFFVFDLLFVLAPLFSLKSSSDKDILFVLQLKLIESWRIFLAQGCSLFSKIEYDWIIENIRSIIIILFVLQMNMIAFLKTLSLKDLVVALRLDTIASSKTF